MQYFVELRVANEICFLLLVNTYIVQIDEVEFINRLLLLISFLNTRSHNTFLNIFLTEQEEQ